MDKFGWEGVVGISTKTANKAERETCTSQPQKHSIKIDEIHAHSFWFDREVEVSVIISIASDFKTLLI